MKLVYTVSPVDLVLQLPILYLQGETRVGNLCR